MSHGTAVALGVLGALFVAGCGGSDVSRAVGARCDLASECDERCLADPDYPGGFCTLSCDRTSDCPGDAACVEAEGGVCLFRCQGDPDCAFLGQGWVCVAEALRGGDPGVEVMVCRGG